MCERKGQSRKIDINSKLSGRLTEFLHAFNTARYLGAQFFLNLLGPLSKIAVGFGR